MPTQRDIDYHEREERERIRRNAERVEWIRALEKSVEKPDAKRST